MEEKQKKRTYRRILLWVLCFTVLSAAAGCSQKTAVKTEIRSVEGYSLPEAMIFVMEEKNRYEDACTDQIWSVQVPQEGVDFSEHLKEQIREFMDDMKVMSLLAQEKQVVLSPEEKAKMALAADTYYGKLSEKDLAYMKVTKEMVQKIYEDYCVSEKLVEELTKEVNLEVSDSEAKVITILEIQSDQKEKLEKFLESLPEDTGRFEKLAEQAGFSVKKRQIGRGEENPKLEEAVFSLTAGEVSQVIEEKDRYYLVQCVSDYDKEATNERKKVIYEERKKKAFNDIYDEFHAGISLSYADDFWKKVDLKEKPYAVHADFFKIYQEIMQQ